MKYKIITTKEIQNGPRFYSVVTLKQLKNSRMGCPRYEATVTIFDMGELRGSYQFIISGYQGAEDLSKMAHDMIKKELV